MTARLSTLVIENFRSIKGQIVVPLDAQVVLIHGTNGMGKTSVLTALELALTGRVTHLATAGEGYKDYLTNVEAEGGSISLSVSEPLAADAPTTGGVEFTNTDFSASPLLSESIAKVFAERSYLPQATLGRLLEIYNDQRTSTTSPLTQFVKEILGLDPLDALVDGLHPAFHVSRVKNLVPEYRRIDALNDATKAETQRAVKLAGEANERSSAQRDSVIRLLTELGLTTPLLETAEQVDAARTILGASQTEGGALAALERARGELGSAIKAWTALPALDAVRLQASQDQANQLASEQLAEWRQGPAAAIQALFEGTLRSLFPELPSFGDGPMNAREAALTRARSEQVRCETLTKRSQTAEARRNELAQVIERSNIRLSEIDQALSAAADNTKTLASALAAVAPHIHTDQCPVCDRDYADLGNGSLSTHVAQKIADLTTAASRIQALAAERAEVTNKSTVAQRDLLAAQQGILPPADLASLTNRSSLMSGIVKQLEQFERDASVGDALIAQSVQARDAAVSARRASELSASILPDIDRLVRASFDRGVDTFESVDVALAQVTADLETRILAAERLLSTRVAALGELESLSRQIAEVGAAVLSMAAAVTREDEVKGAIAAASGVRDVAKNVSDIAQRTRSKIVKQVFNTALNRTWRDLFVRLAPSEDFVPAFKIPPGEKEKVEAVLETVHRNGKPSGSPGSMLSQGNLNTAALTLFLALHLSAPARTPWLILDDPVQSMDDVHIAQFAALLRSLSKGVGRQVVVAVHERALFDYLTLELSPAFAGDSLITVEISRGYDGVTIAKPTPHKFEDDRVTFAA